MTPDDTRNRTSAEVAENPSGEMQGLQAELESNPSTESSAVAAPNASNARTDCSDCREAEAMQGLHARPGGTAGSGGTAGKAWKHCRQWGHCSGVAVAADDTRNRASAEMAERLRCCRDCKQGLGAQQTLKAMQ